MSIGVSNFWMVVRSEPKYICFSFIRLNFVEQNEMIEVKFYCFRKFLLEMKPRCGEVWAEHENSTELKEK